jgi:outer membrane immunogenic protein
VDIGGGRGVVDSLAPARTFTISGAGGWRGDFAPRAGIAYGAALFYANGGFAFFDESVTIDAPYDGIRQDTGWTIGAGVEYMLNTRWTIKGEYLYYDPGDNAFGCCFGSTAGRFDNNLAMNALKIGFNFVFHSVLAPLY